mmetsp:Transcript_53100/g.172635  ORF Transcript_53100/g.172635 Transcript_53100/m.172635 type:complete len:351 (+) Transcript_53100:773-1825(+)
MTSRYARAADARSVSEPFDTKPRISGKPSASSTPEVSPAGGGSLRFRRCIVAPMSARERTRMPLPSKVGKDCTDDSTAFCNSCMDGSCAQFGLGSCLSSCAASAETAFAVFTFSALEMFSAKAMDSSVQITLKCFSTPPEVVGHSSLHSGSQPPFTSASLDQRNPKAFAAMAEISSGCRVSSSQRLQTSHRARASDTRKALRCVSSVRNSKSCCNNLSETIRVNSCGAFLRAKLAKQDAAAFRTSRFASSSAPATERSIEVATAPPVGTALGRSKQTAIQKSQTPTRVLAPTPRARDSRVRGANAAAFSSVISGTRFRSSFIDSLSREFETLAASSSLPFSADAFSMWNW